MKYSDILEAYGASGFLELSDVMLLTDRKRSSMRQMLHRWAKRGWIVPLRRGFYALPEKLATHPLTPERAANQIYKKSYVTGLWRLSQEGLIPEGAMEVSSATLNNSAEFTTPLGRFSYRHLSERGFFGFNTIRHRTMPVLVATPEKALLDFFWWNKVEWNAGEFVRWRIQDPWKKIDRGRLRAFAKRWGQPRLMRAAENIATYLKQRSGRRLR